MGQENISQNPPYLQALEPTIDFQISLGKLVDNRLIDSFVNFIFIKLR